MVKTVPNRNRHRLTWPAYGAAIWSLIFALISFYWAAGGTVGASTLARSIEDQSRHPDGVFLASVWVTGVLKLIAGIIALACVQTWGHRIPRWFLLLGGWTAGIIFTLYGIAGIVEKLLWETGVRDVPTSFGDDRVRWYLLFWDPFWLLGGLLFIAAIWRFQRSNDQDREQAARPGRAS